jgi:hypothetical protein
MNTRLLLPLLAMAMSGCATGIFENRVACTADGKAAVYVSYYGPLGVGSKVSAADAARLCKAGG